MKEKQTAVIFVLMIVLSVLLSQTIRTDNEAVYTVAKDQKESSYPAASQVTDNQIKTEEYKKNGMIAQYPRLVGGGSEEELKEWNKLIEEDFQKLLKIYSFQPYPQLTPVPADRIPNYLSISYEIKRNDPKYISILYHAAFRSPYSAHPTDLIYTTNIDKSDNKRIGLTDMVNVKEAFVKDFRTWKPIPIEMGNVEFNQATHDYVTGLSDKDLLLGFKNSDIIGSGNTWGIYSYLTKDSLGISLGAPHYIGDHIEFEKKYSELQGFIKLE